MAATRNPVGRMTVAVVFSGNAPEDPGALLGSEPTKATRAGSLVNPDRPNGARNAHTAWYFESGLVDAAVDQHVSQFRALFDAIETADLDADIEVIVMLLARETGNIEIFDASTIQLFARCNARLKIDAYAMSPDP